MPGQGRFTSTEVVYGVTGTDVTVFPEYGVCRREGRRPPRDPSKWLVETKESEVAVGDICAGFRRAV